MDFAREVRIQLARSVRYYARQAQFLSLEDVERRLLHRLNRLVEEYGELHVRGRKLTIDITHQELSELVGASRVYVTECLNRLRKKGYVFAEGRHLVIIPEYHAARLDDLHRALDQEDHSSAELILRKALDEGVHRRTLLRALNHDRDSTPKHLLALV
jgi:hypothetical protein